MRTFFHWLADKLSPPPADDDAYWSGWDEEPYLADKVRAALHPVNVEEMPFEQTTINHEGD